MPLYEFANNGKISGRQDGNVMMRNGRSRGMTVPSLVRNSYTAAARSAFSTASSAAWAALTDEERISWNNATGNFVSNRFGHSVEIRGKELYVRCFTNCQMCGTTVPNTYPDLLPPAALVIMSAAFAEGANSADLTFTATPIPANIHMILFGTAPKRPTIYRPKQSDYRFIKQIAPAAVSPASIVASYELKFGLFTATQKVFLRAKMVDGRSGFESAKTDCVAIVAA